MPINLRWRFVAHIAVMVMWGCAFAHAGTATDPGQAWQLLDYVAVDYRGAVSDGQIVSASEYAEMREFAAAVRSQLVLLPEVPEGEQLLSGAEELSQAIAARRPAEEVARLAHSLADALLAAYPVPVAPKAAPNLTRGRQLFEAQCSSCHGLGGAGDGPAARGLDPPPVAFTDVDRARERSPFSYYQIITQGVQGTSMAGFASLAETDRWALAFYASTLAYSPAQRQRSETLWRERPDLHAHVPNLEAAARMSEAALAVAVDVNQAGLLLAFVRSHPEAVTPDASQSLAFARSRLAESVAAYAAGEAGEAQRLALSAYLDGIEPIEPLLATGNAALLSRVELAMGRYRASLRQQVPAAQIADEARAIEGLFELTEQALRAGAASRGAAFLGSFTILLREGLEALLIVVAILAFLRKAQRPDLLPYVHGGWIGALVAGVFTWGAATYLFSITGAHREVTEGASSLFAAVVLLSVGLWMHGKSLAGRWQQYLADKLSHALTRRSVWVLAGLAFVAVYREVFETILFYAALWTQGQHEAILGGLVAAAITLAITASLLLRVTKRLPISQFFAVSSVLIAVLAAVLAGKGVAALQEAGIIELHPVGGLRLDALGIYPSAETVMVQLAVVAAALAGFAFNHVSARRHSRAGRGSQRRAAS